MLDPMIGDLDLLQVHIGTLQEFIAKRRAEGVKTKTLNAALGVVRRILNLAAHPTSSLPKSRRSCFKSCPITWRAWRSTR
jgi:hypothetical protein